MHVPPSSFFFGAFFLPSPSYPDHASSHHSLLNFPQHIHSDLRHNTQLYLHINRTLSYSFHTFSNNFLQHSIPFKHTPAKVRAFQLV